MRVEVHDKDTMTSDFMGLVDIKLPCVEVAAWYTLSGKDGKKDIPRGQLQLDFDFR